MDFSPHDFMLDRLRSLELQIEKLEQQQPSTQTLLAGGIGLRLPTGARHEQPPNTATKAPLFEIHECLPRFSISSTCCSAIALYDRQEKGYAELELTRRKVTVTLAMASMTPMIAGTTKSRSDVRSIGLT